MEINKKLKEARVNSGFYFQQLSTHQKKNEVLEMIESKQNVKMHRNLNYWLLSKVL